MNPTTLGQTQRPSNRPPTRSRAWIRGLWWPRLVNRYRPVPTRRILFLDDDPKRAELFLTHNPEAVWVQTVEECLARLVEDWDEVHLDHDLGDRIYVDVNEKDCGMEVIRWLCKESRPHLLRTLFCVHTHNAAAGVLMVLEMQGKGYKAEFRPFGLGSPLFLLPNQPRPGPSAGTLSEPPARALRRWTRWLSSLFTT
jgi:hypothetical protein